MAVTVAAVNRTPLGSLWRVVADVTFSGSYVTGGSSEAISAASIGLSRIITIDIPQTGGYTFEYQQSTGYVKVMAQSLVVYHQNPTTVGTEVHTKIGGFPNPKLEATNSSPSDQTVSLGPQTEIASGASLSSITARVEATGY